MSEIWIKKYKNVSPRFEHFPFVGKGANHRHKSEEKDFRKIVTKIWCKVCVKHKDEILNNPTLKGVAATAAKAFISGTNSVTKHQVEIF